MNNKIKVTHHIKSEKVNLEIGGITFSFDNLQALSDFSQDIVDIENALTGAEDTTISGIELHLKED